MAAPPNCVVAVVDDDNRVLKSLGTLLASAGYVVRLYSSAEKLLQRDGGLAELDCLVSDIGIPGVDGFELQRVAKAANPKLPVILITGRDDLAKRASVSGSRADALLQKPFEGSDLLAAISKALGAAPR
jgi:FixJ family two-component response regulator